MSDYQFKPRLRIETYTHGLRVFDFDDAVRSALLDFCVRLAEFGKIRVGRGQFIRQIVRIYASSTKDRKEFRFAINHKEDLLNHLRNYGFTAEKIVFSERPLKRGPDVKFEVVDGFKLHDYQVPLKNYATSEEGVTNRLITLQTGKGKGLTLDELVRIPKGWIRNGDLVIGDIVIGRDGKPTVVTGVYPQGLKPTYRLTFRDGRTIECDDTHLWKVFDGRVWEVRQTADIAIGFRPGALSVPLMEPEEHSELGTIEERRDFLKQVIGVTPERLTECVRTVEIADSAIAEKVVEIWRSLGGIAAHLRLEGRGNCVLYRPGNGNSLPIQSITQIEDKETLCISVANDEHLYVARDYVVTHNTKTGLEAVAEIGRRTVLVIKPMYFKKWIPDVRRTLGLKPGEVITVSGSEQLADLIELGKEDALDAKFIIISNVTLQNFYKAYEDQTGEYAKYHDIEPEDLWQTIGVDFMMIDEAHQSFHLIFKMFTYTNIMRSLSLSATIISSQPVLMRMYEVVWPKRHRAPEVEYDKFIAMSNIWYSFNSMRGIRCKNAMGQYSQAFLEQSIMKSSLMQLNWLKMVGLEVREKFIAQRKEGMKCMVFFSTVDMCTLVTDFLKDTFPEVSVGRYVSGDPFDEKNAPDITVTTVQSGGTAIDIPDLLASFAFASQDSKQANVQVLGRTRRLKSHPDVTPQFYCYSAREIEAHVRYARSRAETFHGKVLSQREVESTHRI